MNSEYTVDWRYHKQAKIERRSLVDWILVLTIVTFFAGSIGIHDCDSLGIRSLPTLSVMCICHISWECRLSSLLVRKPFGNTTVIYSRVSTRPLFGGLSLDCKN